MSPRLPRFATALIALACTPAPEAGAVSNPHATKPPPAASESADSVVLDAGVPSDAALDAKSDAAGKPLYQEPPPVVINRHHVFVSLHARAGKRVQLISLLTTTSASDPSLPVGGEALLEYKPKGSKDWSPLANVKIAKIQRKGSAVRGNARELIHVDIQEQRAKAPAAFRRGAKLRLQIDRRTEAN